MVTLSDLALGENFGGVGELPLILDVVMSAQLDGAVSRPDLSQFLSYPPSYPLTTALQTVVSDIQRSTATPPSRIIVVDAQQHPLGVLAVGRLWACAQADVTPVQTQVSVTIPPGELDPARAFSRVQTPGYEPRLTDCQPWLEPIALVPAQASLTDLWAIIQAHPHTCWVVINGDRHYQGVVEAAPLVAWLTTQPAQPDSWRSGTVPSSSLMPLRSPSTQEHTWVMSIGHALKTPLTSLLGLSTLLLDQRIGPLNERQSRYAWLIQQSIRKLTRLINQLVDWMRLESHQIVLGLAPIDLQPFMDALLPTFQASWLAEPDATPAWAQAFTISVNPTLTIVQADRLRLLQSLHGVLDYLLHQDAIPGGASLERWGGRWLGITLWAPSPAPEALPARPWVDPYPPSFAADALEGLGLALARRFCQCHGGELVGFWSAVYGYQMTLLLPLDTLDPAAAAESSPATTLVLLLSTQPALIDAVYHQLQPQGYGLVVASHWRQAIELTQRLAPSIVLLHDETLATVSALALAELAPAQAISPPLVLIGTAPDREIAAQTIEVSLEALPQRLLPTLAQLRPTALGSAPPEPMTLLLLRYRYPPSVAPLDNRLPSLWQDELQRRGCRLLQADDPGQVNLLCRVWQPQAIVLDRYEPITQAEVEHLTQFPTLTQIPIITLAAPQSGSSGQLCLIDASCALNYSPVQGVVALMQRIQAAQVRPE